MLLSTITSTNKLKVLRYLVTNPEGPCYLREIARGTKISSGAAHRVLKELCRDNVITKKKTANLSYYSVDIDDPFIREFKILNNMLTLIPLIDEMKDKSWKIVLFGSWATGRDSGDSDIDIYVKTPYEKEARKIIEKYAETKKVFKRKIHVIIDNPVKGKKIYQDKILLEQINRGKVLWERSFDDERDEF